MDTPRSPRHAPRRRAGFTIIELMIVVAVVAVLAAVAYPSFLDSVRKGRRADAVAALAQVQQAQERWRSNKNSYTTSLADLKVDLEPGDKTTSGYYTISINIEPANATTAYTATATAVSGKSQSYDTNCTVMRVRLNGGNIQYGGCAGCAVPTGVLTDPDRCWSR
jgi:type IV pilus assembly protein PilE